MKTQEELALEEQVERIRNKRKRKSDHTRLRNILNTLFLILAAVGVAWYFYDYESHTRAMGIIAIGMLLKVVEFFVRFLL